MSTREDATAETPELVTFGETMIRLSAPAGERLETARELEFKSAGAESNVATAAAQLETETAWLSKLPKSSLGRRVVRDVRANGVEPRIVWSEDADERQGLYFLEYGTAPRDVSVTYDRADAAVTTATPAELDTACIESASTFFTTGITPALSDTLEKTTESVLQLATEHDTTTGFDLNYRSKLWEPAEAKETYESLFPFVDVLFVPERDAKNVLGIEGDAEEILDELAPDFETVVLTRGAEGAMAAHDGDRYTQPAIEADTVDPIGTGDAFVGGYFAKRLAGGSVPDGLRYGAATAALKRTMEGDVAVVTPEEVEDVAAEKTSGISR